jgi:imidazolonepropionase-like amidohydrolase
MQEAASSGRNCGLPAYVEARVPEMVEAHRRSFSAAMEAGIAVPLGTDCGAPFTPNGTNAKEMEFFVEYGASAMQAIEAGTRVAAEVLGISDRVGTLTPSMQADFVVVKTNPLKDIRVLQDLSNIAMVVQAGNIVRENVARKTHTPGKWHHTLTPVEA